MKLHEADAHLAFARLYLAWAKRDVSRIHFEKGKKLVRQIKYGRRLEVVKLLENAIDTG